MSDPTLNLASRWKRLGGALVDFLISMVICIPIMLATGLLEIGTTQT